MAYSYYYKYEELHRQRQHTRLHKTCINSAKFVIKGKLMHSRKIEIIVIFTRPVRAKIKAKEA